MDGIVKKKETIDERVTDNNPYRSAKKGFFARRSKLFGFLLILVLIFSVSIAVYFYLQNKALKENSDQTPEKELENIIKKVGALMVIPSIEKPTLATVFDPSKLKGQAFFAKAEMGDKVLIFAEAKKAILYSVRLNKILEVAPINAGSGDVISPPVNDSTQATTTNTLAPKKKLN